MLTRYGVLVFGSGSGFGINFFDSAHFWSCTPEMGGVRKIDSDPNPNPRLRPRIWLASKF